MGKIIVIDGTDCSGKETQAKLLYGKLIDSNRKVMMFSFPMYDTPTGMIVGGPYLGKKHISDGWFPEGASNVNPKVASLYYAADRLYNIEKTMSESLLIFYCSNSISNIHEISGHLNIRVQNYFYVRVLKKKSLEKKLK